MDKHNVEENKIFVFFAAYMCIKFEAHPREMEPYSPLFK